MNAAEVSAIFDRALALKSGQAMKVSVEDKNHAISFRTMLYRERKKLLDKGLSTNIVVSKIEESPEETIVIILNKLPTKIVLIEQDGVETPITLDFGQELAQEAISLTIDPDKERMIRMMYEDFLPREEILDYFKDLNKDEKDLIESLYNKRKGEIK